MALFLASPPPLLSPSNSLKHSPSSASSSSSSPSLFSSKTHFFLSLSNPNKTKTLSLPSLLSRSSSLPDPIPDSDSDSNPDPPTITDEWGEKSDSQPDPQPTKLVDSDPPRNEDEWEEEYVRGSNGSAAQVVDKAEDNTVPDLKRSLVDTVYGTEFGFRASLDVRAEVLELVNQLEAVNPTPNPVEATATLDGNWVLL